MWSSIISSVGQLGFGALGDRSRNKADNAAKERQWATNLARTEETIGTLVYRTDRLKADITRDRINTEIAAKKASKVAAGDMAVEAARLGAAGKRVDRLLEYEVEREEGNMVTEAMLAEETELMNATNSLTDKSKQLVDALNESRPTYARNKSFMNYFLTLGMAGGDSASQRNQQIVSNIGSDFVKMGREGGTKLTAEDKADGVTFGEFFKNIKW